MYYTICWSYVTAIGPTMNRLALQLLFSLFALSYSVVVSLKSESFAIYCLTQLTTALLVQTVAVYTMRVRERSTSRAMSRLTLNCPTASGVSLWPTTWAFCWPLSTSTSAISTSSKSTTASMTRRLRWRSATTATCRWPRRLWPDARTCSHHRTACLSSLRPTMTIYIYTRRGTIPSIWDTRRFRSVRDHK